MNDYSEPAILDSQMFHSFQPMPLLKRAAPFDDPDWIYELKMDGFRALAVIEHGRASVALTQRASVCLVLCIGRINFRLPAERQSGH